MNTTQEPKYKIENGKLVNRQSGEQIPDDEPVMIFRAKDRHAKHGIAFYLGHCSDLMHKQAVTQRLIQFEKWANDHPERMKEPGTHPMP